MNDETRMDDVAPGPQWVEWMQIFAFGCIGYFFGKFGEGFGEVQMEWEPRACFYLGFVTAGIGGVFFSLFFRWLNRKKGGPSATDV